jgi:hypothetical protein
MKAYELLDSPAKWTKGGTARDVAGNIVDHADKDAVCWCVLGAVWKIGGFATELYDRLGDCVVDWNDAPERIYEEVIAVLKELDI